MNRREFLGTTTAAGLAVATSTEAASTPPRTLKKAVKSSMVKGASVLERFQLVKDLGYDGIEVDQDLDRKEVLAARDKVGLPIHGVVDWVHWRHPLSHPDPKEREKGRQGLIDAMRAAKAYGSDTVLLVPAVVNQGVSYDAAYHRSQAEIRKVLPLLEELDLKIAIENVWNNFLLSPMEAAKYCDELDARVGWYMDVGNIIAYAWPEQWIRILSHRVFKLDIKEYSRKKQNNEGKWKGFQVEIGDGDCGWARVMKALDEIGYDGWATAEVGGGGKKRLADVFARMDRVLKFA